MTSPCPAAMLACAATLIAAVATDLRRRRIPNALTLPGIAVVFAVSGAAGGWPLFASSFAGALLCAAPLYLAALPGWVGMGDVKLIAVAGAAAGLRGAVGVLVFVSLAGGAQAAAQIAWARFHGRARPRSVPYACAIAAGCAAACLFGPGS